MQFTRICAGQIFPGSGLDKQYWQYLYLAVRFFLKGFLELSKIQSMFWLFEPGVCSVLVFFSIFCLYLTLQ